MTQTTTTQTAPPRATFDARTPREVHPTTVTGLAAIIAKVRQIVNGEQLRPIDTLSAEDRELLHYQALAVINAQNPLKATRAKEQALERAETVLEEEGAPVSPATRNLARRIAQEAILTHTLALQGLFDEIAGGVQ